MSSWYSDSSPLMRRPRRTGARRATASRNTSTSSAVLYSAALARDGCGEPEAAVQRLRAVVPDAHGDAAGVEELPDVVRVHAVDVEARQRRRARTPGARRRASRTPSIVAQPVAQPCARASARGRATRSIPTPSRYRTAAARPTACDTGCVPASNRCGGGRYSACVEVDRRDHRAAGEERRQRLEHARRGRRAPPMPYGPSILWPENTARSTPSAGRSSGRCGADWQASSTVSAPTRVRERDELGDRVHDAEHVGDVREGDDARALADDGCRGIQSSCPSSCTGMWRRTAPVRAASSCQGMRLAWCSISVTTISSPGASAKPRALGAAAAERRRCRSRRRRG